MASPKLSPIQTDYETDRRQLRLSKQPLTTDEILKLLLPLPWYKRIDWAEWTARTLAGLLLLACWYVWGTR